MSTERERLRRARLYCLIGGPRARETARAALAGGADVIQLRDKQADDRTLLERATALLADCRAAGALLVINDRADLARAAGADGVHLGQRDLPLLAARELLGPEALIGVSTHSDDEIERALADGADYIGIGCCYPSPTKAVEQVDGLALVARWAGRLSIPWFLLGGITLERVPELRALGARSVAVSSAVCEAADIEGAARAIRAALGD